jgi:hypothetical protein
MHGCRAIVDGIALSSDTSRKLDKVGRCSAHRLRTCLGEFAEQSADPRGGLFDVLQTLGNGGPVRTPVRNPVAQQLRLAPNGRQFATDVGDQLGSRPS